MNTSSWCSYRSSVSVSCTKSAVTGLNITQLAHSFVSPALNPDNIVLIVGIIGATVMPHALYVHSTLTRDKVVDRTGEEKKRLLKLHTGESIFAFTIAGMVNAAILIVSAQAFYPKFSNISAVDEAYRIMIPIYGSLAAIMFAVTLLCSGLASSTTGTLAGQAVMDGLLGTKVNKTVRRVITRGYQRFPNDDSGASRSRSAVPVGLQPSTPQPDDRVTHDTSANIHRQEGPHGAAWLTNA